MPENAGRVEIIAVVDGKGLDAQVRAIGERAGQIMARSLSKSFNQQMKQLTGDMQKGMRGVRDEVEKTTKAINRQAGAWKRLPHGFRQFTFYTALFATLGQNIAALGSATGAGLTVMGGALVNFGIGVGVVVAAFQNLTGDLEDLPESVRPAAKAFQELGDNFSALQKAIQVRALKNAEGAFKSFGKTVDALVPAFEEVADVVDDLITSFAKSIAPGTKNFANLNKVIKASGPIFSRIAKAAGTFGSALLAIFANNSFNRSVGEFIGWIELLATRFDEFANSPALNVWLSNARSIFGAVGRLLDETGRMLNNLVTPQAIERLVGFIDGLADFMPHLTILLDTLGRLDIFGLIVDALNDFATALEPLALPLQDFAEGINKVVSSGIDQLAGLFGPIAEALAPMVQGFADFMNENPDAIASGLITIAAAAVVLKGAQGLLGLPTKVTALTTSLKGLGKLNWKTLLAGLSAAALGTAINDTFNIEVENMGDVWGGVLGAAIAGGIVGLIAGPQGALIGAALAAVVSWFVSLFKNPEIFQQMTIDIAAGMAQVTTAIMTWFNSLILNVTVWLAQLFAGFATWFSSLVLNVTVWLAGVYNAFAVWFASLILGVTVWLADVWNGIATWFSSLVLNVTIWLGQVWSAISTWFSDVISGWNAFWAGLGKTVADAWNYITGWIAFQIGLIQRNIASGLAQINAGWNGFWSGLGSIVSSVWTGIQNSVRTGVNAVIGWINSMISSINSALGAINNITGGLVNLNIPKLPKAARGAFTTGPTIAGEAGPELIIPLTGALHKVNPAVRPYAEMIRGGGGSGVGGGGTGKIVNVEAGAIVVQAVGAPMQVASAVLDRLVANAAI